LESGILAATSSEAGFQVGFRVDSTGLHVFSCGIRYNAAMPEINRSAQKAIAPFAEVLTTVLLAGYWLEIISHGRWHFQSDISKYYLWMMAAYAGAAEISKWVVNAPTDPSADPAFERINRGGAFIALWLSPLLTSLIGQMIDASIPMPGPLKTINAGLVGIFFVKATSRHLRHKQHGVIDPGAAGIAHERSPSASLEDRIFALVAKSPNGAAVGEIVTAFPEATTGTLYRTFDKLVKSNRLLRTGKPRTAEVRYSAAVTLPAIPEAPTSQN
jgi:hypothetical protein